MREAFVRLLKVKSLITLMVTAALLYGFIRGQINSEQFMQIGVMVFTFYFAKQPGEQEIFYGSEKKDAGDGGSPSGL